MIHRPRNVLVVFVLNSRSETLKNDKTFKILMEASSFVYSLYFGEDNRFYS